MKKQKINMKDFFGIKLSSPTWLIKENTFGLDDQHIQESLFTLGNGFIGSRGVLEEYPERAMPGTYITGVYDKSGALVEELVNLPNPIHFVIAAEGEKLDMHSMGFLEHERYLDMQKGLLLRRTLFKDSKKRKFLYQSVRFFGMHNHHIGWMRISLTLLNGKAELTALDFLDDSVTNYGGVIYGSRRHLRLMDADTQNNFNYCASRTLTSKIWIGYADYLSVKKKESEILLSDKVYNFEIKAGETVTFTKTFAICTSLQYRVAQLKEKTLQILNESISQGFEENLRQHQNAWRAKWEHTNVAIQGDELCDKALRFNIYHLLIAAYKGNFPFSIGARALTGQGYLGHVFWDVEIFMLPFYIYTDPALSKNMLLYRHKRLAYAIANSKRRGYRGALFPWESATKGDEVTPCYGKDADGTIIKIESIDYEHHISADIAYAVFNYYRATDDVEFLLHQGAEIIFLIARFWASRVAFNKKRKKYEILDVIGPDEFHERIKNNAFTNVMASWNMEYAARLYYELKERYPDIFTRITGVLKLREGEVDGWKDTAKKMYVPKSKKGIIEQFEGYFRKKEIPVASYNDFFMPEAPRHISYEDFSKAKFIKQADTLLLFYLLPDYFSQEEKIKNYRYYIKRTIHQSSLSHSTHALLASELGDQYRAYLFFLFSIQVDLKNLHNNTDGGMHMANNGGVWQAAIFGFAGISVKDNKISISPRLPAHWQSMKFNLFWKRSLLKFDVSNNRVKITAYPARPDVNYKIEVEIFDKIYFIEPFKTVELKLSKKEVPMVPMKRLKDIIKDENYVFVKEGVSIKEATHLMSVRNISSVPVVSTGGKLCGIISKKDIVNVAERKDLSRLKARDVMNKAVEYVKADDHVEIALRMFTERSFQLLPVVKGKVLVGCITRKEILSACSGEYY